jgi:cadmium resistance protein CadD (predicted permease)
MNKSKRVGTFTFGVMLVITGSVFILYNFGWFNMKLLLSLWPVVLILLGIEVLWYSFTRDKEQEPLKYDVGAFFLIFGILAVSFVLEGIRLFLETGYLHWLV